MRIRPGIFFQDHPAFGGRKRELVAQDYVYSIKRVYDPRLKSPRVYLLENAQLLGMNDLRDDAERVMLKNFPNSKYLKGGGGRTAPWWQFWN